ncbi:P-loop containing nucleoside triphosphate hydrolase protein [Infundibulicybe gibba]|nr:P-loop containing nucleoside triphosphate hydrolase protein [Infundibulicybe gibba]
MSTILPQSRQALHRSSLHLRKDEPISSFHSCAALSKQFLGKSQDQASPGPSKTRFTKDLTPGSRSRNLEVAPRTRSPSSSFTRDPVPHSDWSFSRRETPRPPVRRRSEERNTRDLDARKGRWAAELESSKAGRFGDDRMSDSRFRGSDTRVRRDPYSEDRRANPYPGHSARSSHMSDGRDERRSAQPSSDHSRHRDTSRVREGASSKTPGERQTSKPRDIAPVISEFYDPPALISTAQRGLTFPKGEIHTHFSSPPILPGLLSCLHDLLGPDAAPTPIQSLSLKWLLASKDSEAPPTALGEVSGWKQFLLASETGSGKSIAYLLPVLQSLKELELQRTNLPSAGLHNQPGREYNPKALILAPTHELSRQLSSFAKALLHKIKLRVLCASKANVKNAKERDGTSAKMVAQFEEEAKKSAGGEFEVRRDSKWPVDVVVGTPMKLLEMVRGRGWDRKEDDGEAEDLDEAEKKLRRGRDKMLGFGKWRSQPEMGLANVEWVVVDEADVLFDPDFQETTRQLLADISEARGHVIPIPEAVAVPPTPETAPAPTTPEMQPTTYPFNLILTSATIPASLASYLDKHHPKLMRLASPNLHHLPKTLQTEYVNWSGGNKYADIERRVRRVWAEDSSMYNGTDSHSTLSKVLIFCNRSTKVAALGEYLHDKGIKNIALTSTSEHRKRGSNHHLDGFLRQTTQLQGSSDGATKTEPAAAPSTSDPAEEPHVMITTSLLSRGLDFSPEIRHVFIVDEPRNMIDFLHRAGRSGRAGQRGKVVVFGKMKGRGSAKAKDVRKRVGALVV